MPGESQIRGRLFVAESFRTELQGKVSAIGLYTDNIVVMIVAEGEPDPTAEAAWGIPELSLLVAIGGLEGTHKVNMRVQLPDGTLMWDQEHDITFTAVDQTTNMIVHMRPCAIQSLGVRNLHVLVNGNELEFPFEFRRASAPKT